MEPMAIFPLHVRTIGRSKGESAVATATRRADERLYDHRTGRTWNHALARKGIGARVDHRSLAAQREATVAVGAALRLTPLRRR